MRSPKPLTFVFEDIAAAPVASLLRDFSAPVQLDFEQTDAELTHLMAHDADAFNRWEVGQRLATRVLLAGIAAHPAFDLKNPNKVYALVRSFCGGNPRHFHRRTAAATRGNRDSPPLYKTGLNTWFTERIAFARGCCNAAPASDHAPCGQFWVMQVCLQFP